MDWNRSETIALAAACCVHCDGIGLRLAKRGAAGPCSCVLRAIFRACLQHFRLCAERQGRHTMVSLEHCSSGGHRRAYWAMKNEDYMADFLLVSRKALTVEEYDLFRFHYLLGADCNLCCRRLGVDRGAFYHAVYRVQRKLGRVFSELEPYPLYPLQEYFGASGMRKPPARASSLEPSGSRAIRPPVLKTA